MYTDTVTGRNSNKYNYRKIDRDRKPLRTEVEKNAHETYSIRVGFAEFILLADWFSSICLSTCLVYITCLHEDTDVNL